MIDPRNEVLEQLIRDEWPKLRRFFRSKVPLSDVVDLVQSTMLGFVEGRARITGADRAYLWGIARNQVLKYYGKHRPTAEFNSEVHTALDLGPTISSRLDRRTRVLAALHELPVDHQIVFELRHGEGLSLEEVAAAFGKSLATVKRHLALAEDKLRASLGDQANTVADEYTRT